MSRSKTTICVSYRRDKVCAVCVLVVKLGPVRELTSQIMIAITNNRKVVRL